jgi:hypothetical protein
MTQHHPSERRVSSNGNGDHSDDGDPVYGFAVALVELRNEFAHGNAIRDSAIQRQHETIAALIDKVDTRYTWTQEAVRELNDEVIALTDHVNAAVRHTTRQQSSHDIVLDEHEHELQAHRDRADRAEAALVAANMKLVEHEKRFSPHQKIVAGIGFAITVIVFLVSKLMGF